jgi:uncharacterized protein YijF (DUF1287 family)
MTRIALFALLILDPALAVAESAALELVAAARAQISVTVIYDPSYRSLAYPGGDVPAERGVCTDVVIRAYRQLGLDLQVAVHEDMKRAWREYPGLWGLSGPDRNIDHRRVPNLAAFLRRMGAALPLSDDPGSYLPGDLVTWKLPSGVPHIGIVSDRRAGEVPLVIHNIGAGAAEEDVLFGFRRTGHFRLAPPETADRLRAGGVR